MTTATSEAGNGAVPPTPFEAPDFEHMKVADIKVWVAEAANAAAIEDKGGLPGFDKMKAAEKRARLKAMFADPADLESPEVTGFDPTDPIQNVIAQVEALASEADAADAILRASDDNQYGNFRLGGILATMLAKGWFTGFDDFYLYVENTYGFRMRKAQTLMQLYRKLVEIEATGAEVKKIGWTKLATIATLLNPENKGEWFKRAAKSNLASLIDAAKTARKDGNKGSQLPDSTSVKKLSFKIHEDQEPVIRAAIEHARTEADTEYDGPALHFMSVAYLNRQGGEETAPAAAMAPADGEQEIELEANEETLTAIFTAIREEQGVDGLGMIFTALCDVYDSLHVEVYPDGKPDDAGDQ